MNNKKEYERRNIISLSIVLMSVFVIGYFGINFSFNDNQSLISDGVFLEFYFQTSEITTSNWFGPILIGLISLVLIIPLLFILIDKIRKRDQLDINYNKSLRLLGYDLIAIVISFYTMYIVSTSGFLSSFSGFIPPDPGIFAEVIFFAVNSSSALSWNIIFIALIGLRIILFFINLKKPTPNYNYRIWRNSSISIIGLFFALHISSILGVEIWGTGVIENWQPYLILSLAILGIATIIVVNIFLVFKRNKNVEKNLRDKDINPFDNHWIFKTMGSIAIFAFSLFFIYEFVIKNVFPGDYGEFVWQYSIIFGIQIFVVVIMFSIPFSRWIKQIRHKKKEKHEIV